MESQVAVVVPTYNRCEISLRVITRLLRVGCEPVDVIICDSGSTDGTVERCAALKSVRVIDVGSDAWWTGAVDVGVRAAALSGHKWIVVLNDDLKWDGDLIGALFSASLAHPGNIIVPKQVEHSGKIFRGGFVRNCARDRTVDEDSKEDIYVDFSNGCCICTDAETFSRVGYFNPTQCPHLGGDMEFFLRAKAKGVLTFSLGDVCIEQMPSTPLRGRYRIRSLLTAPDSPYKLTTYCAVGAARFGGVFPFVFFGFYHHIMFGAGLLKAAAIAVILNRKW